MVPVILLLLCPVRCTSWFEQFFSKSAIKWNVLIEYGFWLPWGYNHNIIQTPIFWCLRYIALEKVLYENHNREKDIFWEITGNDMSKMVNYKSLLTWAGKTEKKSHGLTRVLVQNIHNAHYLEQKDTVNSVHWK